VVITIDMHVMMKKTEVLYRLGMAFMGLFMLAACSGDSVEALPSDGPEEVGRTETWTVTIEPEYVLADADKSAHRVAPAMEAVDGKGNRIATFGRLEVADIALDEGYRYNLQIEAKLNSSNQGSSAYTYKLRKLIDKTYVGFSNVGRREVMMDVVPVRMKPKDETASWSYETLCGYIEGSDEKIDMLMGEIQGLDYKEFYGSGKMNRLRISASITPSSRPIYEGKQQRIRLIQVLSKDTQEKDSIVYVDSSGSKDTIPPASTNPQYGDFEMVWSANGVEIGKGVLHAEINSSSTFGIYMETESNMTKFFVDSVFKKPFKTFEIQKVTFDVGAATFNSAIQYSFVGYSSDAYYYNIKDWKYTAIARIDGEPYQFQPIVDYEKSSMTYDSKSKQWLGAITIKQVDFSQAYYVPSPPWTENYPMKPVLKIVFNTTKKIK